jgi:DNA-binding transcriptional MerR regulator
MDRPKTLIESGGVARRVGVSVQSIRNFDNAGVIPQAIRSETGRRYWLESDIDEIAQRVNDRRGAGRVEEEGGNRAA